MRTQLRFSSLFVAFSVFFLGVKLGWTRPFPLDHFTPHFGGEIDIPEEAYVDGSSRYGGLQPDYWLNTQNEAFDAIRQFAHEIQNRQDLQVWKKIEAIEVYIRNNTLDATPYCDPIYLELLKSYRNSDVTSIDQINIPLSDYLSKKRGVCREHAFLLHFALKWAGIENKHLYVKVESLRNDEKIIENHAILTVQVDEKKWVIDSYFNEFNGFLFEDLIQKTGIETVSQNRRAPFAFEKLGYRRIVTLLNYPIVWTPSHFISTLSHKIILKEDSPTFPLYLMNYVSHRLNTLAMRDPLT